MEKSRHPETWKSEKHFFYTYILRYNYVRIYEKRKKYHGGSSPKMNNAKYPKLN